MGFNVNEIPYLNEIIGSIVIIIATMVILLLDQIKKSNIILILYL